MQNKKNLKSYHSFGHCEASAETDTKGERKLQRSSRHPVASLPPRLAVVAVVAVDAVVAVAAVARQQGRPIGDAVVAVDALALVGTVAQQQARPIVGDAAAAAAAAVAVVAADVVAAAAPTELSVRSKTCTGGTRVKAVRSPATFFPPFFPPPLPPFALVAELQSDRTDNTCTLHSLSVVVNRRTAVF